MSSDPEKGNVMLLYNGLHHHHMPFRYFQDIHQCSQLVLYSLHRTIQNFRSYHFFLQDLESARLSLHEASYLNDDENEDEVDDDYFSDKSDSKVLSADEEHIPTNLASRVGETSLNS